jgi:hypothetical protein
VEELVLMSYRSISYEEAVVGMTVVLTTHRYGSSKYNPTVDSEYECTGVIDDLIDETIYVSWANGCHNDYRDHDLSIETGHKRLQLNEAVVGMRVMLATNRFRNSPSNPRIGGKFECVGTITHAYRCIRVIWDNGLTNSYTNNDLIVKDCGEGSYVDMWRNFC